EAATEALGAAFAAGLDAGDVIVLTGPLGAGKTRFVAGMARGLRARSRVRSPSFTLINEYRGDRLLLHLDLYRLEPREAEGLTLRFEIQSENGRAITARAAGARGLALLKRWRGLGMPRTRDA